MRFRIGEYDGMYWVEGQFHVGLFCKPVWRKMTDMDDFLSHPEWSEKGYEGRVQYFRKYEDALGLAKAFLTRFGKGVAIYTEVKLSKESRP